MRAGKPGPRGARPNPNPAPTSGLSGGFPVDKLLVAVENSIMNEASMRCGGAASTEAGGYAHPGGARRTDAGIRKAHPPITIPGIHT